MKTQLSILFFCLHFTVISWAQVLDQPDEIIQSHSAVRLEDEDPRIALERENGPEVYTSGSAASRASSVSHIEASLITAWDKSYLQEAFEKARDYRFLFLSERPDFPRRIAWLFPDDGCYARATLMGKALQDLGYPRPAKVFAFGHLKLKTNNSPRGTVYWSFHVAPIVQAGGLFYVLDPSVEPRRPLQLFEWVKAISRSYGEVSVSVCNSYTYTPGDGCNRKPGRIDKSAQEHHKSFLRSEWSRLYYLGRNPELELGEHPPWINLRLAEGE